MDRTFILTTCINEVCRSLYLAFSIRVVLCAANAVDDLIPPMHIFGGLYWPRNAKWVEINTSVLWVGSQSPCKACHNMTCCSTCGWPQYPHWTRGIYSNTLQGLQDTSLLPPTSYIPHNAIAWCGLLWPFEGVATRERHVRNASWKILTFRSPSTLLHKCLGWLDKMSTIANAFWHSRRNISTL